jgi:hypothetical protein
VLRVLTNQHQNSHFKQWKAIYVFTFEQMIIIDQIRIKKICFKMLKCEILKLGKDFSFKLWFDYLKLLWNPRTQSRECALRVFRNFPIDSNTLPKQVLHCPCFFANLGPISIMFRDMPIGLQAQGQGHKKMMFYDNFPKVLKWGSH